MACHERGPQGQVEWWLLDYEVHRRFQDFCSALNDLYRAEPALYEIDFQASGFEWIDFHDSQNSIVSFVRRANRREDYLVLVCNFTPQPHTNYRIGMPEAGLHREIFNSDAGIYGGSNMGNQGGVTSRAEEWAGWPCIVTVTLPPLAVVVLKPQR